MNFMHLKEHRETYVVYFILILMVLVSSLLSDVFLSLRNINNILRQSVCLGLVSIGQTFVILTAGIDLSVGAVISLTSCLTTGLLMGRDALTIPVVLLVLAIALSIGFCNGFIITRTGIPPLIVTLGTMELIQGGVFLYTDEPYGQISPYLEVLAWGKLGFIPVSVLLFVITLVVGIVILRQTKFGRHIYAIGGNEETARLSGIKVNRVKIYTYMLCSFTAALTGILLASRMGMGDPTAGEPFMLESLVPVMVGGTSLMGGKGGLIGTLAGIFILTVLNNSLNMLDVSGYWQWVVEGVIIVVAVAFYLRGKNWD